MKKVLIITPFYPPFPRPGATKRIENFVRYLPENGWDPIVLTMDWGREDAGHDRPEKIYYTPNIARMSWRAYQLADVEQPVTWKSRVIKKIFSFLRSIKTYILVPDEIILWLFWLVPSVRKIVKLEQPSLIFVSAPPNSSLITGALLKKIFGLPLVCDIRDDWADNPIMEKKSRLLRMWETKLEAWVTRTSDLIILVTASSQERWNRRYSEDSHRFCMIPNGYSEDEFQAVSSFRFDGFALVHVGSLESNRSPEVVYRALSKVSRTREKIGFYQYGLTLRKYRELAVRLGVDSIVHHGDTIPGNEALARIKGASLLVLLPTRNAPTAIPGKAYEYLRTGKPILMISEENSTTALMKKFSGVYHVLPGDEEQCREIIDRFYSEGRAPIMARDDQEITQYDRRKLTALLANRFSALLPADTSAG